MKEEYGLRFAAYSLAARMKQDPWTTACIVILSDRWNKEGFRYHIQDFHSDPRQQMFPKPYSQPIPFGTEMESFKVGNNFILSREVSLFFRERNTAKDRKPKNFYVSARERKNCKRCKSWHLPIMCYRIASRQEWILLKIGLVSILLIGTKKGLTHWWD